MFNRINKIIVSAVLFVALGYTLMPAQISAAANLELQRNQFIQAKNALRANDIKTFKRLSDNLIDYPLYPYLIQYYLSSNLWKAKDSDIINFLDRYSDLTTANDLRRDWLKYLARRGRWQTYVDNYKPQSDETLKCYHLHARLQINKLAYLLEDTRSIWLSGKSLPPQCDSAFALLYKSDLLTGELVWQRIRLAMTEGNASLAKYLERFLDEKERIWVSRWIATHHNPSKWTSNPKYGDTPVAREILVHGILRLARQDIDGAIRHWDELKNRYAFETEQANKVEWSLTIWAARNKHKNARQMLDRIANSLVDDEIFHQRLSTALREGDWQSLLKWTTGKPPADSPYQRWLYWHGRSLEETGDRESAMNVFRQLSRERDYYGFLATEKLGQQYDLAHRTLPEDLQEWSRISKKPAIVRARELHILGMNFSARREWRHAFLDMTSYQLQIAASIAANWGWYDQTILTLGRAEAYDDLVLRFPLPYEKLITNNVGKRKLDLSWVYALTRAESIFMEDAQSSAGALGLMQVMPATGRETARKLGIKKFYTSHLFQASINIPIGTEYLRKMYDRYNQNIVLATAAYNAGPNRVDRWLPEQGCMDPEIWIEQIPFKATRKYVRRILYYASIYDWRLQKDIKPVGSRMAMVTPVGTKTVAELSCPGQTVAINRN